MNMSVELWPEKMTPSSFVFGATAARSVFSRARAGMSVALRLALDAVTIVSLNGLTKKSVYRACWKIPLKPWAVIRL